MPWHDSLQSLSAGNKSLSQTWLVSPVIPNLVFNSLITGETCVVVCCVFFCFCCFVVCFFFGHHSLLHFIKIYRGMVSNHLYTVLTPLYLKDQPVVLGFGSFGAYSTTGVGTLFIERWVQISGALCFICDGLLQASKLVSHCVDVCTNAKSTLTACLGLY